MQVVSVLWLLKDSELTLSFSQGKKRVWKYGDTCKQRFTYRVK